MLDVLRQDNVFKVHPVTVVSGPYLDSDLNNLKERETERKKGGKKREITDYILEGR